MKAPAATPFHVQAHRGACAECHENTLPAFERALEIGADSIELDLHVSRDGQLVVYHDFTLDPRFVRRADGTPLRGRVPIRSLTGAEIQSLEVFDPSRLKRPKGSDPRERRIPSLAEVFQLFRQSSDPHAKRILVDCEVKSDPRFPRLSPPPREFARRLLEEIREHWSIAGSVVRSFDHRVLAEVKALAPDLPIAALTGRLYLRHARLAEKLRPEILSPDLRTVFPWRVAALHRAGVKIMPYTANTPAEWNRLIALGVDGITTDDPRGLIAHLKAAGRR